jgi:hypothetical protein
MKDISQHLAPSLLTFKRIDMEKVGIVVFVIIVFSFHVYLGWRLGKIIISRIKGDNNNER